MEIPDFCVVALVGPSGSGKSHLARRLFREDEVLSSDFFRKLVCGDDSSQEATDDAFDCLYHVAGKRLERRKLTVIDATNLSRWARSKALDLARDNNCFCIAILCNIPENDCLLNNGGRGERQTPKKVIARQCGEMRQTLKSIKKESFRQIHVLNSLQEADELTIRRIPLWTDLTGEHGPFDIIGDVHGCYVELCVLLRLLGYEVSENDFVAHHPLGRKAVFLGDLCDRGPANISVLRLVMNMVKDGHALAVPGNHDDKLLRHLQGKKVQIAHGLERTLAELEREDKVFRSQVRDFLAKRVSHYMLDDGKLVACHAGLPAKLQGRSSKNVREFCLYGDPSGELDQYGLPVRNDWARDYRGKALVAYGHSPDPQTRIVNNTVCLDGGCVFGGNLTALRYPELEIISSPAQEIYCSSAKLLATPLSDSFSDSLPDAQELLKRQRLETGLGLIVIRDEERSIVALETMGRFAADPRWLIYLPPTMSPCETSALSDYLEHPVEALAYYKTRGVKKVICQEKHMGSRAIAIICKDEQIAEKRFASSGGDGGIILTRTGRPFFASSQKQICGRLLQKLRSALDGSGFWREYSTDWVCLDCEIMPWSFKAQRLIASQYEPYGIAGANGLGASLAALKNFASKGIAMSSEEAGELASLDKRLQSSLSSVQAYNKVWKSYCQPASDISDIKIAPFHILATEGRVWSDITHDQQLEIIAKGFGRYQGFVPTKNIIVDPSTQEGAAEAAAFWDRLLADGGEGMVVKPLDFIGRNGAKLLQPAIKCRGKEYLRIIYGAEYTKNIEALKPRSLAAKRKRAIREFALGLEALECFVKREPLYKVHECVFTILALETEPQDARL